MKDYLTPKIILLSALYFIVAAGLLFVIDIGLYYFFYDVVFKVFDWFNDLNFILKILILIFGGFAIFICLTNIISALSVLLGGLIFNSLPKNYFTQIVPTFLALANAAMCIIWLWSIPPHYNFWVICELIILSLFIWSFCAIVIPAKEHVKDYQRY